MSSGKKEVQCCKLLLSVLAVPVQPCREPLSSQKLFLLVSSRQEANNKGPVDLRCLQAQVDSNNICLYGYEANSMLRVGGEYRGRKVSDIVLNNVEAK